MTLSLRVHFSLLSKFFNFGRSSNSPPRPRGRKIAANAKARVESCVRIRLNQETIRVTRNDVTDPAFSYATRQRDACGTLSPSQVRSLRDFQRSYILLFKVEGEREREEGRERKRGKGSRVGLESPAGGRAAACLIVWTSSALQGKVSRRWRLLAPQLSWSLDGAGPGRR